MCIHMWPCSLSSLQGFPPYSRRQASGPRRLWRSYALFLPPLQNRHVSFSLCISFSLCRAAAPTATSLIAPGDYDDPRDLHTGPAWTLRVRAADPKPQMAPGPGMWGCILCCVGAGTQCGASTQAQNGC